MKSIFVAILTFSFFLSGFCQSTNNNNVITSPQILMSSDSQKLAQACVFLGQDSLADAVDILLTLSVEKLRQGRIDLAMAIVFKAQDLILGNNKEPDAFLLGRCNQMLGEIFFTRFMETEAILFYHKALNQYTQCGEKQKTAEILRALAEAYSNQGDMASTEASIDALRRLAKQENDINIWALANEAMGDFYSFNENYEDAVLSYRQSLDNYLELQKNEKVSDVLLSIAICIESDQMPEMAQAWVDSALRFNKSKGMIKSYYEALYYKAEFLSKTKPREAIAIATGALDSLEALDLNIHQGIYLKLIANLEKKLGDFENAMIHTERFHQVLNEIYGSDAERKIASLQLEVETEKFNHSISDLQKEKKLVSLSARSQRNMVFYFILASIILLTMALNNMRRLQYRLYLLKEFALDVTPGRYVLFFFIVLFYFTALFKAISPLQISDSDLTVPWFHFLAIGLIAALVILAGIIMLPAHWSAKPGFNRRFSLTALAFMLLLNVAVLVYAYLFKLSGASVFDKMNIILVLTGITIMPVFFAIIYLEKVLLKKHIQMAGLLTNKISKTQAPKLDEVITIYSDRARDSVAVPENALLLIEAQGNYAKIIFTEGTQVKSVMLLASLKILTDQLSSHPQFSRCHKSYIVNLSKVKKVMGNSHGYKLQIPPMDESIPVSRSYAEDFIKSLDKYLQP